MGGGRIFMGGIPMAGDVMCVGRDVYGAEGGFGW